MKGYEKKDKIIWNYVITGFFGDIGTFNHGYQLWDALASESGNKTIEGFIEDTDPSIVLNNEDLSDLSLNDFFSDYINPEFERFSNLIKDYNNSMEG